MVKIELVFKRKVNKYIGYFKIERRENIDCLGNCILFGFIDM